MTKVLTTNSFIDIVQISLVLLIVLIAVGLIIAVRRAKKTWLTDDQDDDRG